MEKFLSKSKIKRLVISGATGMIGSTIVKIALGKGFSICCIVREDSKRSFNLPLSKDLKLIECNLDNYRKLVLDESYDTFIHLAWDKTFGSSRDDVDTQLNNIQYTLDAVRLAQRSGCSVFVGAGSQAEYGRVDKPLARRESPLIGKRLWNCKIHGR